jgi:hypothetical protein
LLPQISLNELGSGEELQDRYIALAEPDTIRPEQIRGAGNGTAGSSRARNKRALQKMTGGSCFSGTALFSDMD